MKKFEKFVFLSNYWLITAKVYNPRSRCCCFRRVAMWRRKLFTSKTRALPRKRASENKSRRTRDTVGGIPGKNLRWDAPDKTRKQPRTRLQLPPRGTNCAAGRGNEVAPFVLHAKSIWTNESLFAAGAKDAHSRRRTLARGKILIRTGGSRTTGLAIGYISCRSQAMNFQCE